MKQIQPVTQYDVDTSHPEAPPAPDRRQFLRQTLGGALALGSAVVGGSAMGLLADEPEARAGRRQPRRMQRIWFQLLRRHTFSGGRFQVDRILFQTRSRRLTEFLEDRKERAGLDAAIRAVLSGASSRDLTDQKRLARLQQQVAHAVARRFRAVRRRSVSAPIVTLEVRRRRRVPVPGGIRPPRRPYP